MEPEEERGDRRGVIKSGGKEKRRGRGRLTLSKSCSSKST